MAMEARSILAAAGAPTRQVDMRIVSVAERQTEELVIGLVGAIGAGVSTAARVLAEILEREYGYSCHMVRVSRLIEEWSHHVGLVAPAADVAPHKRVASLQNIGNKLRGKYSNSYLAEKCVEFIAVDRLQPPLGVAKGYAEVSDDRGELKQLPVNRRRVHIVDSLKHTDEVDLLREVYGDTFWLFGVFAPERVRHERLLHLRYDASRLSKTFANDEEDGLPNGQKVRDTAHLADFFLRNDGLSEDGLKRAIGRHLRIIFNIGVNTPTLDETAMYNAASQASTSACLSRQVGAAIFSGRGELLGVGANDVPKFGGGLYCAGDGDGDHRCFRLSGGICHNDERKDRLYAAVLKELRADGLLDPKATGFAVTAALKRTEIRNLIEYSRSVHAEMEAIISVARGNKPGLVGATLYSTTFPCHSCARHIVASGIARVIYIEPYAKSLALELHGDAVSMVESEQTSRVTFLQYEGVAPKNMIRLFKHGIERKAQGRIITLDPRVAKPIFPSPLDGFAVREQLIVDKLAKREKMGGGGADGAGTRADGRPDEGTPPIQLSLVDPRPEGDGG